MPRSATEVRAAVWVQGGLGPVGKMVVNSPCAAGVALAARPSPFHAHGARRLRSRHLVLVITVGGGG